MNYQEPFNICNIDFDKIVYPKSRSSQNKKIILIKYNDQGRLKNFVFQTPTLLNLYKVQKFNNYSEIEVALSGKEELKISKFINFIDNLEKKIKEDGQYHYNSWFNINDDHQTINFQKTIRESDDYDKGTIKIKIINNNDFQTSLQMNNNKNIKVNDIPEESWCKMILECYAVWINSNNDFGLFIRPILVSFSPKETYNYKFVEESEEEDFNIPETEINNNIFMKINNSLKTKYNNSTTQLDIKELVKNLDNKINESTNGVITLDINDNLFNDNSSNSSNCSINLNNINNSYIDADTSD